MILNLPNVSLLGLNQTYRFLGAGFNYSNSKQLSIDGTLNDLAALSGISGTWSNLYSVKSNQSFDGAILNGFNFGSGRILNINFDQGDDVKIKRYSLDLEVFETGNLFNFTGSYYSGINTTNFQYLQNFNENYSFDKKKNGGYSYNHNASIQFNSGVGQVNAIDSAKVLAKSIFTGSTLGFAFFSGYTSTTGKRFFRENYNIINNECSFEETFDFDYRYQNFSLLRTNSYSMDEVGAVTVEENASIRGILEPTYDRLKGYLNVSLSGAYERCSELVLIYGPSGSSTLINEPISKSVAINLFDNSVNYSLSYSNNRSNLTGYFWNYTQSLNQSDGISVLTENGNVIGRGGERNIAYSNAVAGFSVVKLNAKTRADAFFLANKITPNSIFLQNQSKTISPFRGSIDYSFIYSNEVIFDGRNGVKYIKVLTSDENPVYIYTKYGIFNEKTIIQDEKTSTEGSKTLNLEIHGEKNVELNAYLDNAKDFVNNNTPSDDGTRIVDAGYSYDKNNSIVNLRLTWAFDRESVKTIEI
jgi:hypothetical protein